MAEEPTLRDFAREDHAAIRNSGHELAVSRRRRTREGSKR